MRAGVEAVLLSAAKRESGALDSRALDSRTLERLFRETFFRRWNTLLVGGGAEPLYLPAGSDREFNRIVYRADYFASALHEVSHWCIAGRHRRTMQDYGYWYQPDGRTGAQQAAFAAVEAKPQALEWLFSVAAGHRFQVSVDNLGGEASATGAFEAAVAAEARRLCVGKLPLRAQLFARALSAHFGGGDYLSPHNYSVRMFR